MTWTLAFNSMDVINFHVTESGTPSISGFCQQVMSDGIAQGLASETRARIDFVPAQWRLTSSHQIHIRMDAAGDGLFSKVRANPDRTHAMVTFSETARDAPIIDFDMVLPPRGFREVRRLLEVNHQNPHAEFAFQLGFEGFEKHGENDASPTAFDFVESGVPVFLTGVCFTVIRHPS